MPCMYVSSGKRLRNDGLIKKYLRLILGRQCWGGCCLGTFPFDLFLLLFYSTARGPSPWAIWFCAFLTLEMPWIHNLNPGEKHLLWGPKQ